MFNLECAEVLSGGDLQMNAAPNGKTEICHEMK
jgi:hypothetical protein